ncbi:MAG TPA: toprim domain-containing protein, partial [Saprospiraceae bacterium]|nr:toprim domain-containing protein [Saprospiraceae bacterium]
MSKKLLIVESPAKAKTIQKYLGNDFEVKSSYGHIRDLDKGTQAVDIENGFEPKYIVPIEKRKLVKELRDATAKVSEVWLATDEDREGEAISWHLTEVLKPKVPVKRLVFHEITREAIQEALQNTRDIDTGMVRAQETRRILDRLYGYDVSQLLWKKVKRGLSAGRVQSVAVRLIVERERERMAFRRATYWDLEGHFSTLNREAFTAELFSVSGRRIPTGKDFDATTGILKDANLLLLDEAAAREPAERHRAEKFTITS